MEKINIIQCKRIADGFRMTGAFAAKTDAVQFFKYYIGPCAANLAFACELYMKTLKANSNERIICKGHYLQKLYEDLNPEQQCKIRTEYKKVKCNLDLDKCLEIHNKTFEEWRYLAEYKNGKTISVDRGSLLNLANALSKVCEEEIKDKI
ncbi:hypothetical protein [uncultured Pseudoramibacter sp.]|uniref:hypothetical protein n=1 Tax=uncultured Pseudoramibacter sp. TaxID=1623493 RepID=UPI0025DC117D|nr:hypothetical protein [uncultured Pseudoramibacter sp.]